MGGGLTGLFGLVPLIVFGLWGGAIADVVDRRMLLVVSGVGITVTSALLGVTVITHIAGRRGRAGVRRRRRPMGFGMPRAVFPQAAVETYGGGPAYGLLSAAIAGGAAVGGLLSGRLHGIARQGVAVTIAVCLWASGSRCPG